jgi:hypothetical protein
MSEKAAREALRELMTSEEGRGNAARLRALLGEIEQAQASGVGLNKIHGALVRSGFTFSFQGFKTALQRARREQGKSATKSAEPRPTSPAQKGETFARPELPTVPSLAPLVAPPSSGPALTEKQEKYRQFQESIKHLPERERRKLVADYITREADSKSPFEK